MAGNCSGAGSVAKPGSRIDPAFGLGISPDEAAIIRLIGAVLLDANDEWQRQHRSKQTEAMVELTPTMLDVVPNQISTVAAESVAAAATPGFHHVD